jgi:hypothetical protein
VARVVLAVERARQLAAGAKPMVQCDNKFAVTVLREVADGAVSFNESVEGTVRDYLAELKKRNTRSGRSVLSQTKHTPKLAK